MRNKAHTLRKGQRRIIFICPVHDTQNLTPAFDPSQQWKQQTHINCISCAVSEFHCVFLFLSSRFKLFLWPLLSFSLINSAVANNFVHVHRWVFSPATRWGYCPCLHSLKLLYFLLSGLGGLIWFFIGTLKILKAHEKKTHNSNSILNHTLIPMLLTWCCCTPPQCIKIHQHHKAFRFYSTSPAAICVSVSQWER